MKTYSWYVKLKYANAVTEFAARRKALAIDCHAGPSNEEVKGKLQRKVRHRW
jgi:hypothetical protein